MVLCAARAAAAQSVLERPPNLSGGWVGLPGYFYATLPHRFRDVQPGEDIDIAESTTFDLAFGLPGDALLGARVAPESRTLPGNDDEWEIYGRLSFLEQARGRPLDLAVTLAYNGLTERGNAAFSAARWLGPLRLLGEVRALGTPADADATALAAGAVLHVREGALPVAIAGDVASRLEREPGEKVAWSAGIQVGLSYAVNSIALVASNTSATTLEATSRGGATWWGFELTIPITTFGRLLGMFAPREQALEAVVPEPPTGDGIVSAPIRRYAFLPARLEVAAGTVIEWTNEDDVIHTVTAEDASFDSEAIRPGQSWRARFDRPGRYPYFCGPHPFMKGIVIVR